ncbi:MAG: CoB--CoM heterodisulfide reductase iron-sulfur subunit A family protein [Candidatus Aminicenantes bacterium]|nr:CoB--CoM heterodisulfide reductase iron-sulfur subunit A family protein [Candidatus Aminicenantes bacterium]
MNGNIGVYVCECGPNIGEKIDIDKVLEAIASLPHVKVAKRFGLLCSNDGKKYLEDEMRKEELTHVVIAACSPRDHEQTFMTVAERAGLNPYLVQLVNIREQCAWMIPDKEAATEKAIKYIRAGISRVSLHQALTKKELEVCTDVLVIGGGISGIETALSLAGEDRKVFIVEKSEELGGKANKLSRLLPHQGSTLSLIQEKIDTLNKNAHIEVFTGSQVVDARGFLGNFEVVIQKGENAGEQEIKVGAVVVATGFDLFNPEENPAYGLGKVDNVVTSLQLEEMIKTEKVLLKNGKPPRSLALIHCVGRSEKGYCSKTCCLNILKNAHFLKDKIKDVDVTEIYRDLCLPNKADQDYYEEVEKKGVKFLRSNEIVNIKAEGGQISVEYKIDGKSKKISVDMAVLSPAMIPSADSKKIAEMLNLPLDPTGFIKEAHGMLEPIATPIEGVFAAGCSLGPKNIPESIIQAQATAGNIISSLIPGKKIKPEVKVSVVREEFCTGCQTCLSVCFYGAISFDPHKGVSVVNEAICRGCGSCVGSCPSGAIRSKHFTYTQLYREVLEALR